VFPHRIEVGPRGKPERQRLVIERVEVNPTLDAARFAPPPGMPKEPRRGPEATGPATRTVLP
jgi:hypothetical protein